MKVVERPKIHFSNNSSLINSVFWTYRKKEIDYRSLSFSQDFLVLHFTQSSGETLDVGNLRKVLFSINMGYFTTLKLIQKTVKHHNISAVFPVVISAVFFIVVSMSFFSKNLGLNVSYRALL